MFSKIRIRSLKRLTKTDSKAENKEEIDENSTNDDYELSSEVVINHASRIATNAAAPNSDAPNLLQAVSGVIEPLTLFEEVDISEHPSLFLQKIQLCCILCDFSDDAKFIREKEIKRQTLCELVDLMQYESLKLTEAMQEELIHMVSVNIFRCLPPSPFNNIETTDILDPEDEDVYLDPSWPHLQLAYEILLRYIMSSDTDIKIAKRFLDHIFLLKLLDLFDSEDMREREYLKTILHRIYGNFMVHRPFIRKAISNIFYQFIFETQRHNGIAELLEILASIIDGFTMPIKQEHRMFLIRTLIPLHKPKSILIYHQQLSYCVVQFVQKDYRLVDPVIKGLLKYWPLTNCQKEVLFLAELEEVLESTKNAEFQRCMVSLFRKTSQCLNSPHFQACQQELFLLLYVSCLSLMQLVIFCLTIFLF